MTRSEILDKAKDCVTGKREQDYGSPEDNFKQIAKLWTAYFDRRVAFEPLDVAIMMALMKIARIRSGTATEDSFVDACGYLACGGEIANDKPKFSGDSLSDEEIEMLLKSVCEEKNEHTGYGGD